MQEIWKPIKGYEGLYEISNLGKVKSLIYHNGTKSRILKPRKNKGGYLQVGLYHHNQHQPTFYTVHRLVGLNFIDNPNNFTQINHIDGDKTNNQVDNLQWCNSLLNNRHRVYVLKKSGFPLGKRVKCIETGVIYNSINEAEREYGRMDLSEVVRGVKGHLTYADLHWELM